MPNAIAVVEMVQLAITVAVTVKFDVAVAATAERWDERVSTPNKRPSARPTNLRRFIRGTSVGGGTGCVAHPMSATSHRPLRPKT